MWINKQSWFTATLFLCSTSVTASNLMPQAFEKEDDAIWQIGFTGQYDDQSNNLAEASGDVSGWFGGRANPDIYQLAPVLSADPEKEWGYAFNLAYIFPSHKYDVRANYAWLNTDQNTFIIGNVSTDFEPHYYTTFSDSEFHYKFQDADITAGQLFKKNKRMLGRLGIGVAYADIKQTAEGTTHSVINEFFSTCTSGRPDICPTVSGTFENKFKGIGPKFTADGQYNFNPYLGVVGGVGLSLLYGNSEAKLNAIQLVTTSPDTYLITDEHLEDDKLAFGLDGVLGLLFSTPLIKERMIIDIEAGYQFTSYLNALQEGDGTINIGTSSSNTTVTTLVNFDDNYFNSGFYINLTTSFM